MSLFIIIFIGGVACGAFGKFLYNIIFDCAPPVFHVPPPSDVSYKYNGKGFCENSPWHEFKHLMDCDNTEIRPVNFLGDDYLVTEREYNIVGNNILRFDGSESAKKALAVYTRRNEKILKDRKRRHPYNCC